MSSLNKSQLRTENSDNFPNNNSQFITPEKLRDFNNDVIDSMVVNQDTGSYLVTSSFDTGSREQTFTRLDGTTYTNLIPGGGGSETGSLLETASFDNGTRDMTFTKGDGTTFTTNIPDATVDTGSLLVTASVVDATTTYTKGDGSIFTTTIDNVVNATSSSHAVFAEDSDDLILNVKNTSGADIGKGLAVHATGVTGENVNIELADSSNPSNMPSIGITRDIITNNASGVIVISGKIIGLNTSGLIAGEQIYVNGAGVLTSTKPTGSDLIQNMGVCGKVNATEGEIIVQGSGRVNDLPNITDGYGWFGNTNGVPTAQTTASFAKTDINNTFSGNQTFNDITVNGTGSFAYISSVTGSSKTIGDAFIILNNDTPTLRYAGLKVQDSGSANTTASLQYDGGTDDWFFEKEVSGVAEFGVSLFGPEYTALGVPTYNTNNTIPKGSGGHHLNDSNITDNGTTITLGSTTNVSGPLSASNLDSIEITNLETTASVDRTRIDGLAEKTGSYALLGVANAFTNGPQTITDTNGYLTQNFDAPGTNAEKAFFNVSGASINSTAYNRVFYGMADYPSFGDLYEDYFAVEYYDGGGYNYGSEFSINGLGSRLITVPNGGGAANQARFQTNDDGDNTSTAEIRGNTISIGPNSQSSTITIGRNGTGTTNLKGATEFSGDNVTVSSPSTFQNGYDATFDGGVIINNGIIISSSLDVASGNTSTFNGTVNVNDVATFNSTATLNGTVNLNGTNVNFNTGNILISSSLQTAVGTSTITSETASIDFGETSLFELTLVSGSTTHITANNILEGQTINVLIKQPVVGTGSVTFAPEFLQPSGSEYTATAVNSSEDILTFITYKNQSKIYTSNVKQFLTQ